MCESGLRTKTSSQTIRESPPNPLKSILTVIVVSSIARDSPLKSGGHWGQVKAIEYLRTSGPQSGVNPIPGAIGSLYQRCVGTNSRSSAGISL